MRARQLRLRKVTTKASSSLVHRCHAFRHMLEEDTASTTGYRTDKTIRTQSNCSNLANKPFNYVIGMNCKKFKAKKR